MDFISLIRQKFGHTPLKSVSDNTIWREARLQQLLDLTSDAVVFCENTGVIRTANSRAAAVLGFSSRENLTGQNFFELISANDRNRTKEQMQKLAEGKSLAGLEFTALRKDESQAYLRSNFSPIGDDKGNLRGFVGVMHDITGEKAGEKSKSFTASIVESADDAIIGKDLNGVITSWNKGAEKLYGYQASEAIGQPVSLIYPPELKEELSRILERLAKGELIHHFQTVRMDRHGNRIPVSLTISPVLDESGHVRGVSSIARDISREKELDRLKDEFISLTSHALRTPLSAIKGLISMIYEGDYGPMNKNLEKPIANISLSTERLIKLVNDLLNISRAQTGKLELKLTAFYLQDGVEKAVKELMPIAQKNGIELKFTRSDTSKVQADQDKTRDIITNLISNALKFTNKGSIELMIKEDTYTVILTVKDTGIGIADSDKPKLFQRFQQIANNTSKQVTGTGLGLYLSKMLAQKLGGDVWLVSSILKQGSTFAFSLPKEGTDKAKEVEQVVKSNQNHRLS